MNKTDVALTNSNGTSAETERQLAAGVLKQAAQDLRRFHNATTAIERKLYFDAYSWVMSDDYSWPFSFPNVCRLLNRFPEELRQELVDDLSLGPVGLWVRRCQRAAGRFSDFLRQRLVTERRLSVFPPVRLAQTSPLHLILSRL